MDGAIFIATAFKENHQLTYIKYVITIINPVDTQWCENSFIMKTVCLCKFCSKVLNPINKCINVRFCSLQGNGIGESGAKVISDTIRGNTPGCVVDI